MSEQLDQPVPSTEVTFLAQRHEPESAMRFAYWKTTGEFPTADEARHEVDEWLNWPDSERKPEDFRVLKVTTTTTYEEVTA